MYGCSCVQLSKNTEKFFKNWTEIEDNFFLYRQEYLEKRKKRKKVKISGEGKARKFFQSIKVSLLKADSKRFETLRLSLIEERQYIYIYIYIYIKRKWIGQSEAKRVTWQK